jgi:hypothetical protein
MSLMGLIRRNFSRIDREDFNILYKGYIRPHLEYAVQAWSPHLHKVIRLFGARPEMGNKVGACFEQEKL